MCIYTGIFFLAAVMERAFFGSVSYLPAAPDLVIGIICVIALADKKENAIVAALIGGVVTDALSGASVYLSPLVYFALALTLTAFSGKMMKKYPSYLALLGVSLAFRAAFTFGMCCLAGKMGALPALIQGALPKVISTAVFCIPIYFAVIPTTRAFSIDGRKVTYE